jgi:hypothetical protein
MWFLMRRFGLDAWCGWLRRDAAKDPGPYIENRAAMIIARFGLFAVAVIFIVVGA